MRGGGRGPERFGVAQPFLLREQLRVLARHRVERLDLFQGPAEILGFGDPLAGHLGQLGQLRAGFPVPRVGALVVGADVRQLGPGVGVQGLPLPAARSSCC